MSALGFILLAVIVFMLGWQLIGVTDAKTTSIIAGTAALLMGASVVFQGATVFGASSTAPIGALLLLWAIYGALIAAMGIYNAGGRALGLYALLLSLAMLAFAGWFFTNGLTAGVLVTLVVAVPFFLQFIEEIVPVKAMRGLVGYTMLIAGVISAFSGLAIFMHLLA
jgi:hypothetical protein